MYKTKIIDGTKDYLFKDCKIKRNLERKLQKTYLQRGCLEIITPTIEYFDVFSNEDGNPSREKMYRFFDNNGNILVLRPDMTIPIGRVAATKLYDGYMPLRFCYTSSVFRENDDLSFKKKELTQSGVEVIGFSGLKADLDVIITAIEGLIACGLENFKFEIGEIGIFKSIIEKSNLDKEESEEIRSYIENKIFAHLNDFLEEKKEKISEYAYKVLLKLPRLFGGEEVFEEALDLIGNKGASGNEDLIWDVGPIGNEGLMGNGDPIGNEEFIHDDAVKSLMHIKRIYETLVEMGYGDYVSIDLGMVHHIDYYTGIIFRAYAFGYGTEVLAGGRYDNLLEKYGKKMEAIGFAINIDNLFDAMVVQGIDRSMKLSADYLIYYSEDKIKEAYDIFSIIAENGHVCEMDIHKTRDEAIAYARNKKINNVIFVEDEVKALDVNTDIEEYYNGAVV